MVTAGNKAKRPSSVNHTTKTIHHHHHHHHHHYHHNHHHPISIFPDHLLERNTKILFSSKSFHRSFRLSYSEAGSLVVSDLLSETKDYRFEFDYLLCARRELFSEITA